MEEMDNSGSKKQWTLNPDAAVFVPRAPVANRSQPPAPKGTTTKTNPYPNGNEYNENENGEFSDITKRESDSEVEDYVALCELKDFIDNISSNPAQYDTDLSYITDVLNNWINEDPDIIMQCIVNTIVDQAIMDTNFRYNGVRLCVHLIANLKTITTKGTFKDILLQRCQRELSRRDSLAKASDSGLYLRGVALFIADLSTRVDEVDLVEALPELIETLLSHTTTENVKCACNILKLCGTHLEEYLNKKRSDQMDSIIDRLKAIGNRREDNPSLKNVINNVVELKGNGWKTLPNTSSIPNPYASGSNNPYRDFDPAANNNFNNFNPDNPSYDFGPCGDEGDQDVCDAFEEFLRASGQLQ